MKAFATFVFLVLTLHTCFCANNYIAANSVRCVSTDIHFTLSQDSELFNETHFDVDLYTGLDHKILIQPRDFDPTTGIVTIPFATFTIVASTAFGPNQRPLLYNIDQPFWAVPKTGFRNYTFGVFCTIPAYYNVNVTTNTTDDGHGDHEGDVVVPKDHVKAEIQGVKPDESVTLGDRLTYSIYTTDNTYAALIPVSCQYYNPANVAENMPVVRDSCPSPFPVDPDGYFQSMVKKNDNRFELNFRAFAFETAVNSFLGVDCDILLCISKNADDCKKSCWGDDAPSSAGTTSATTPATEEVGTTGPTTEPATMGTETTELATTVGPTTESATTEEPTTEAATTEEATTQLAATTPELPVIQKIRFVARYPRAAKNLQANNDPTSVIINDKRLVKVNNPTGRPQAICDTSVLTLLYGVVGALAVLVAFLVLTLICLLCLSRRRKVVHYDHEPMFTTNHYNHG